MIATNVFTDNKEKKISILTMEYYSTTKGWQSVIFNKMDRTEDYYLKWNKSDTQRQFHIFSVIYENEDTTLIEEWSEVVVSWTGKDEGDQNVVRWA